MRLELSGVRKEFGKTVALRNVSLIIPSGAKVALVGPNGSGKSTLIRAIMGLLSVEGRLTLDGRDPRRDRDDLAVEMAYVPQIAPRLAASVAEVVRAIASVREIEPETVARTAARLDFDVAAVARKPFRDLSGGMKQKLLIALALSRPTPLVILDEPTASLDAAARACFFRLFAEVSAGATLLLCSHRQEEVETLVDHVVALDDGCVAYDGPASDYLDGRVVSVIARIDPTLRRADGGQGE